jgi:hypothetical protein
MAYVIPSDAHVVGDPGHTPDHDNMVDVLGLLVSVLAQGAGPSAVRSQPPGGNAAAITALQTMLSWAGTTIGSGYFPWQFPVEAYGAQGNGRIITDGQMVSGSPNLNSAAQANFTTADIGKSVLVSCAGGGTYTPLGSSYNGGTPLPLTILSINGPTQAVLSQNASSTTPGNSICGIATDDSTAINNAVAAAVAYAQNGNGYAEVLFSNRIYGLGGTYNPVNYQSGLGNSLIPLPIISPTAQKILLAFTGPTKTLDQALIHWDQVVPQAASSVIMCMRTDGSNNGTFGPSHVMGTPIDGYGGDLGLFTNMMPVIDGVQIVVPYNSTYGGFDFFGAAEAVVENASCLAMALVNLTNTSGAPYPNMYLGPGNISNQWGWGLRLPCTGNNDRCDVFSFSSEGMCYGIGPSEHSSVEVTRNHYGITGIETYSGNSVLMPHALLISYASCEGNTNSIGFFDGTVNADVLDLDSENASVLVYDPSNRGIGTIGLRFAGGVLGYNSTPNAIFNSALQLKLICLDNAGLVGFQASGAPAAPGTTVAQINGYYRDAFVYVTSTTAITIAKVQNDAAATLSTITGLSTAAAGTIVIPVPAGRTYSVTSTGTITTQWVLL